ncbi:MAG: hypothetical protein ISS28_08080 [Candidatus Cloacimonetes bacterium]|nr:hypothetical protein [Candidatus Cloacimonadota bacterium]
MRSPEIYLKLILLSTFFFTLIYFLPIIQADIISLNPGGSNEFAVTTDRYIEGFFFGEIVCVPDTCAGLGHNCGSWSDDCGGTLNCGACGSGYTCTAGTCVADEAPPSGNGVAPSVANIALNPTEFNIYMEINTNVEKVIRVTNLGTSTVTVSVTQQSLDNNVILGNTSLTISAGQTVELDVVFVALSEPGIYTGRIIIGGKVVLVTLNVRTELLLFDSNIVVLNEDYKVRQGEQLKTLVTLIPMGDPARLDVTLDFVIKDYANRIYLTRSETLLVNEQVQLRRNFDTGNLPTGDYIVGLELVYPGGVAPSSAHFIVIERAISTILGKLILFLLILILIIAIIIIILLIIRKIKERRAQKTPGSSTT